MSKYKGELEGFPDEVVEKMLEYQVAQGNKRDVTVFEKRNMSGKRTDGFFWDETLEGYCFWYYVIINRNFDLFFKRYPKKSAYPKIMMVSNMPINESNKGVQRVVFMGKCGTYIAWHYAKTFEEAETVLETVIWKYVKDIEPETNSQKQELLDKANELIKKAEELKSAAEKL